MFDFNDRMTYYSGDDNFVVFRLRSDGKDRSNRNYFKRIILCRKNGKKNF